MESASDITASDIIDALGPSIIQELCGVGEFSIRAARREGRFPASWFDSIERACAARGIECPREIFTFKRIDSHPSKPKSERGAA